MFEVEQYQGNAAVIDPIEVQAIEDYEQLQRNYSYSQNQKKSEETVRTKKLSLYDRMDSQWIVLVEIGFTLSTLLGTGTAICLMRVFGAGFLATGVALSAVASALVLMVCCWGELTRSEYKLRVFVMLIAIAAGLTVSMSDAGLDWARDNWRVLATTSIVFTTSVVSVLGLIMASKGFKGE
jgi:multisubunit Na+/H+ antiporter MnhB subunit